MGRVKHMRSGTGLRECAGKEAYFPPLCPVWIQDGLFQASLHPAVPC